MSRASCGVPAAKVRDSRADEAQLITDPEEKAIAEARNGLRQFDAGIAAAQAAIDRREFKLRPSLILSLHRAALAGISAFAGNYRPAGVAIEGSEHEPIGAHLVPEAIEEMCDYVNDNWKDASPIHLSAYVMWRLNWIHPFADGNGRTSRILSHVILCVKVGLVLPSTPTIPEQIVAERGPYFDSLEKADAAWKEGRIDVSMMEALLHRLLARQLTTLYDRAASASPVLIDERSPLTGNQSST